MTRKRSVFVLSFIFTALLFGGLIAIGGGQLLATELGGSSVPELMTYQGYLTDSGGTALDGSYTLTFRIYDASTGGTKYWEESHSGVGVNSGYFAVTLGSQGTPLGPSVFEGDNRYIEVSVNGEAPLPRQRFAVGPLRTAGLPGLECGRSHLRHHRHRCPERRGQLPERDRRCQERRGPHVRCNRARYD